MMNTVSKKKTFTENVSAAIFKKLAGREREKNRQSPH